MKEINYKDMKFNPFNLIGGEWMLVTAGNEQKCNTMTASWGHLGCLWGHNDPTAVIYQKHWSDVYYEKVEDTLVQEWIKEFYQLVASKLPKAIRQKYIQMN